MNEEHNPGVDKKTRNMFMAEQRSQLEPKRPNKCTCSRDGMLMSFHKDYCALSATPSPTPKPLID